MPYRTNARLPLPVRRHLPARAQDLYRETFNNAWSNYAGHPRREEVAHRTARVAVKRQFHKEDDGQWRPNIQ
ncbi:MAG: cation transporter [Alphaproteobacteria bacterium]|nr:cation transporter [Alphaproteobacteria bacterium]